MAMDHIDHDLYIISERRILPLDRSYRGSVAPLQLARTEQ